MFRKLSLILSAVLMALSFNSYADTTVVIGDGSGEYSTFAAALSAIHGMSNPGRVTILVTKSTVETTTCDLRLGDDLVLTNNSNRRCAIQFDKDINSTRMIAILHGAKLTIGGGTKPLILRASDETNTGGKFFDDGSNVLIKVYGGELDILDNVELCYGKNVIWMTNDNYGNSPVVNMHGGVIHSATDICVNITQGTFNMDGGYICGHYFTGSQIIPDFTANPLLDYSNVRSYYGHDAEESVINPENGIQAYLASSLAYNTEVENLNYAMGVYVHRNENTVDAPTTQFNMSGGVICGINAANEAGHKINIDINGVTYIYYDITDKTRGSAVLVNKSEFNFTGGKIYANYSRDDGPGFRLTDLEYNYDPGYDFGHVNMSGNASISYCQCYPNGGGTRVEKGVTFTMSGGEISHCLAGIGYSEGVGGGGGLRLVGAKFVMSGDAEMCWNHSTGLDENFNGGAIGAVWQQAYGTIETVLDLQGGKIHHNLGEANGGGISATDKGNLGATGINVTFNGVKIYENTSKTHGGGVYVGGSADVVIKGNSEIYNNTATGNGGGLYVSSANTGGHIGGIDASACKIYGNLAAMGGGIYTDNAYVDIHAGAQVYGHEITGNGGGICVMSGASYTQDGGEIGLATSHNKAANGAGVYVGGTGNVTLRGTALVDYNDATANGGGVFLEGGDFTMENGNVKENTAAVDGGGFYVLAGSTAITGGIVQNNIATSGNGGGFYSAGGTVNISNATISGNHADNGFGGGLYSAAAITVGGESGNGATVSGNEAKDGAGFYVAGASGSVTTIQGNSIISGNHAMHDGAGAYIASGNLTVKSSDINSNAADGNGGGFYVQGGLSTISGGTVQYNTATKGAGLYMEGTSVDLAVAEFENGVFQNNVASGNGGGIYLAGNSALTMSGTSQIVDNHVLNVSGHGGGVMVDGGQFIIIGGAGSSLKVNGNYVGESTNNSNNVYLNGANDYITIDKDNGTPTGIKVGISINGNDIPKKVVFCENSDILNAISGMITEALETGGDNSIFDDAHRYEPLISAESPFEDNYLYFVRVWSVDVTEEELNDLAAVQGIKYIDTPKKLAAFMMLVNGYKEGFDGRNMKGVITADLKMGGSLWIPIGGAKDATSGNSIPFTGSMDGGGHIISNLISAGLMNYNDYGLFGKTDGAEIKNIVIENCNFVSGEARRMGALICDMKGGTVENCIASGKVIASGSETYPVDNVYDELYCVVGGLIGEASSNASGNAQIINCMSTVEVEALPKEPVSMYPRSQKITVGGLVGMTSSGTVIRNSYVHAKISHRCETRTGIAGSGYDDPTDLGRYVGGLVGINNGEITNCYVRFQEGTQLDLGAGSTNSSLFGMFAGSNTGSIINCYAPDKTEFSHSYPYLYGNAMSGLSDYGDYGKVVCPYTYGSYNTDNKVTKVNGAAVSGKFLLDELNSKVTTNNGYSHWMRTSASPINGDYPVLSFDNLDGTLDYTTVGSKDGIQLEYGHSVNPMITRFNGYADGGSLYIYKTPGEMQTSRGGDPTFTGETITEANEANVNIYLQQDVALKNDVDLQNVNACVVLDNSEAAGPDGDNYYWHMFSTPLTDAPLGIDYSNYNPVGAVYGDPTHPVSFNNPDGYFPTDTPYGKWDFYCYNEKHSTWINYKRYTGNNNNIVIVDHYDTYTEGQIPADDFTNETTLIPGKGYLAAADTDYKQGLFLQAKGTLNKVDADVPVLVPVTCSGHHVTGCNFIGNPYHAYLDFDKFCGKNGISSYSVIADGSYVSYAAGGSKNPSQASRYIHPHQGFIVKVNAAGTLSFSPDMAVVNQTSPYRESHVDYPLVNLFASDSEGIREIATAELGRPENGGALKIEGMQMGKCTMSISNQGERYGIAFIEGNPEEVAVHFQATEDGDFTMKWNTYNGTFSYLHLIDNLTGMDIDCLASDEYKFTARTGDYASRFKLKFEFTGVEENEAASAGSSSFAFFHQGSLVVNGQGNLELIDLSGRVLMTKNLGEGQSTVALPEVPEGLYLLRLADDSNVKTQKIIIK